MGRPRKNPLPVENAPPADVAEPVNESLYPMVVTAAAILIGGERFGQDTRIEVPAHVRASLLRMGTARDA